MIKNLPTRRRRFDPWVSKIPERRKWQPTPVFLPGKSHGQRSLAGYRPWGHKELDMTEQLFVVLGSGYRAVKWTGSLPSQSICPCGGD